jgi:hypothetical protein
MTECTQSSFCFASHFSRQVVARFDGGQITSDAGVLLLRPVEQRTGILRQFAACFRDYRKPELVEHNIQGEDQPGAVAQLLGKLSAAGINITSVQAVAAGAGVYGGLLWVKAADVRKAARALGAG